MNAVVIGGGHRGMTATHGGFFAAVTELRRVGGGATVADERELKLKRRGMKLDPTSFLDEGCLLFEELEISDFSFRDAIDFPRSQLESSCKLSDPIRDSSIPEISEGISSFDDKTKYKLNYSSLWSACLQHAVSVEQEEMGDIEDLLSSPASKVLNKWLEACGRGYRFCLFSPSTLLLRNLECIQ